jgi:hypothetical protein
MVGRMLLPPAANGEVGSRREWEFGLIFARIEALDTKNELEQSGN